MSFLRSLVLSLAVSLAAVGAAVAADPQSLVDALPEKRVPDLHEVLLQGLDRGP